jgi:hypothetical protein
MSQPLLYGLVILFSVVWSSGFIAGKVALWLFLIRKGGAATASAYHLLNPSFGVLLSHFILKTPIRQQDLAGAGVIALGLLITISAKDGGNDDPRTQAGAARSARYNILPFADRCRALRDGHNI